MATSIGNCGVQGAGPGRPKGSLNKFTTLKNAFLETFERTGGTDTLTEWGKQPKNRRDFYRLLAKLLPKEVDANVKTAGDSFLEAFKEIESREKKSKACEAGGTPHRTKGGGNWNGCLGLPD